MAWRGSSSRYSSLLLSAVATPAPSIPPKMSKTSVFDIDLTSIAFPKYTKAFENQAPMVFLQKFRFHHLIKFVQRMNPDFPVGRPRTEEIWFRYVNEVWLANEKHIKVDRRVPFPLSYSEVYFSSLFQRVKNEIAGEPGFSGGSLGQMSRKSGVIRLISRPDLSILINQRSYRWMMNFWVALCTGSRSNGI